MATQAAAPAPPALLPAWRSHPAGVPGPAPAGAAAEAEWRQAIHPDHLHLSRGLPECGRRRVPGPSPVPPVGIHGPRGPSGRLEPGAPAIMVLGLLPRGLILRLGAVALPPLVHRGAPAPPVAGGPAGQGGRGCPATAAAQVNRVLHIVGGLGHGSGSSRGGTGGVLETVVLGRMQGSGKPRPLVCPRSTTCSLPGPSLLQQDPLSPPLARSCPSPWSCLAQVDWLCLGPNNFGAGGRCCWATRSETRSRVPHTPCLARGAGWGQGKQGVPALP